jgi:hypothetical protein
VKVLHKICAPFKKYPYCIRPGTLKLVDLSEETEPGNVVIFSQHSAHKIILKGGLHPLKKISLVSQATPAPCKTSHCFTTTGQHNLGSQSDPCLLSAQPFFETKLCPLSAQPLFKTNPCPHISPAFVHNQPLPPVSSAFVHNQPLPPIGQHQLGSQPTPAPCQLSLCSQPTPAPYQLCLCS